jgi:DNA-binding response OmpR family regulator
MSDSRLNELTAPRGDRRLSPRGGRRAGDLPGHGPTLVVADSHADVRGVYERYLDRFGFRVQTAAGGDDLFAILRETQPALILMESTLTTLPWWHVAVWLRTNQDTRSIPIIVLAGGRADDFGADSIIQPAAILQKPFELPAMVEEIRFALRTMLPVRPRLARQAKTEMPAATPHAEEDCR